MTTQVVDHKQAQADTPPARTQKKNPVPLSERLAYTPAEFASLFGKHPVWAYRRLYAGDIKALANVGNLMIPRTEVERLLNSASVFDGKQKRAKTECAKK
jgi:hypothetical protein